MVQQLGNVEILLFGAGGVEGQRHEFEMVFRFAEVGRLGVVAFRLISSRSFALCGPFMELHHLAHGRGHTAGIHMAAAASGVGRALAVPRVVLVPKGLAKRTYHGAGLLATIEAARFVHRLPFGGDVGRGLEVVFADVLDFLLEVHQSEREGFRHVLRIVVARSGVGEDGLHTVVGRNDDEAFAVFDIEDVIVSGTALGGHADQLQLDASVFLAE